MNIWTKGRQRRLGIALILGLCLALIYSYPQRDSPEFLALYQGDFPSFYSVAQIYSSGQGQDLYSPSLQRTIQNQHWATLHGGVLVSVYPPAVALLLSPLTELGSSLARTVFDLIMLVALLGAILVIRSVTPGQWTILRSALLLSFPPTIVAVLGGQLTALNLLLLALSLLWLRSGRKRDQLLLGVVLGVWLIKPQFAIFGILAAVVSARWWSLVSLSLVAAVHYVIGLKVVGSNWFSQWLAALFAFGPTEFAVNGYQMSSLVALGHWFDSVVGTGQVGTVCAGVVSIALLLLILGALLERRKVGKNIALGDLAVLFIAIGLLSPKTLFYDLALVMCVWLMTLDFREPAQVWRALLVVISGAVLTFLRNPELLAGFPIFVPFAAYLFYTSFRSARAISPR